MQKNLVLLMFPIAALSYHQASAASFDCNKAKAPIELMICADPELSQEDEALGRQFKTGRLALTGEVAKSYVEAQKAWLKQRYATCNIPTFDSISNEQSSQIITCLKQAYSARIAALSGSTVSSSNKPVVSAKIPPNNTINNEQAAVEQKDVKYIHFIRIYDGDGNYVNSAVTSDMGSYSASLCTRWAESMIETAVDKGNKQISESVITDKHELQYIVFSCIPTSEARSFAQDASKIDISSLSNLKIILK